jgi:hypothetical protein
MINLYKECKELKRLYKQLRPWQKEYVVHLISSGIESVIILGLLLSPFTLGVLIISKGSLSAVIFFLTVNIGIVLACVNATYVNIYRYIYKKM